MAAFTSAQAGKWNDGATWGNSSPGTKGVDWPGSAGDTATIAHDVLYNVSEANALGDINVNTGGILRFKYDANTKLVLGQNNLNVNGTGELRIGNDADPIGSPYPEELSFPTTSDNGKGLVCAAASALNIVGSDLTGGTLLTYLIADWSAGQTFTVHGDVTAKWAAGQKVVVYRFRGTYQSGVDTYEYTIASMAAHGSDTDITISEAAPGVTFRAGGLVAHVTRNVIIGKASATATLGNYNSNRPYVNHAGTSTTTSIATTKHASFFGCVFMCYPTTSGRWDVTGCVTRNGLSSISTNAAARSINSIYTDCIFLSNNIMLRNLIGCKIVGGATICCGRDSETLYGCDFNNHYLVNCMVGTGSVFIYIYGCNFNLVDVVGAYTYFRSPNTGVRVFNSNFGKFRHHANTCAPTYDFLQVATEGENAAFYNSYFSNDPLTFPAGTTWWGSKNNVNLSFDDFNNVLGDTRRYTNW